MSILFIKFLITIVFKKQLSRSEEHTSELQSRPHLVCRLLLEKKNEGRLCSRYRPDVHELRVLVDDFRVGRPGDARPDPRPRRLSSVARFSISRICCLCPWGLR